MRLNDQELMDLAVFLSRRDLSEVVRGDAYAWMRELEEARDDGRLGRFVRRCAALRPDDANLARMADLVVDDTPRGAGILALMLAGGGAVAVAGLIAVGVAAIGLTVIERSSGDAVPVTAAVATADLGGLLAPMRNEGRAGRCVRPEGGIIGYWYAGASPGAAGDLVRMPHDVNVRSDYPGKHNGWNSRSRITCVLKRGDLVRLSEDPVVVPPGRAWVPLVSGDLQPAETARLDATGDQPT